MTPSVSISLKFEHVVKFLIPETEMNRYFRSLSMTLLLAVMALPVLAVSPQQAGQKVFVGEITDGMCGMNGSHTQMMNGMSSMGHDKDTCTRQCVRLGVAYVLLDPASRTVYHFDDPAKAEPFAGRKVRVTGMLEGQNIKIATIEAAN
jgi:hypothetical protein